MKATIRLASLVSVLLCLLHAPAKAALIFSDDFNDNDISDWSTTPGPTGSAFYSPSYPDISGGVIRGKGSGYSLPLYTWMIHEVVFDGSSGFALELRSRSGSSLPNQVAVELIRTGFTGDYSIGTDPWSYEFTVPYGEGNKRIDIRNEQGGTLLGSHSIGGAAHSFNIHRIERDGSGNWSYYLNGSLLSTAFTPDNSISNFGYLGIRLYRNQSEIDWIRVETLASTPEPLTVALLALSLLVLCPRNN